MARNKIGPIAQYVQNKFIRDNTTFVISKEGTGYLVGGKIVAEKEFNDKYPLKIVRDNGKGPNPCRKYIYLNPNL